MSLVSLFVTFGKKGITLAREGFALGVEQRRQYQSKLLYGGALSEVAFLSEPQSLPGDIYVFGDPRYYFLSSRRQAIAINGLYPPTLLPELWMQIFQELKQAHPPYIFISKDWKDLVSERSPQLASFLQENYRVLRLSESGTWYVSTRLGQSLNHNPSLEKL